MDKPGLSPDLLRIARTTLSIVWVVALAIGANEAAMTALGLAKWQAVWNVVFGVLAGKELLPRLGDVSPAKHQLEVERATSRPPSMQPPPAAEG